MKTLEWLDYDRFSEGYSENYFASFMIMEKDETCFDCYFSLHGIKCNGRIYIGSRTTIKNAKKYCENTFKLI
jgi:hypothetical protein